MNSQFGARINREKDSSGRVDTLRLFIDRTFAGLDPIHVLLRSQTHLAFYWEVDEDRTRWTFLQALSKEQMAIVRLTFGPFF